MYAVTGQTVIGLGPAGADGRRGGKIVWVARPEYAGPAIIRGARIDGPGDVLFTDGTSALRFDYDTHVRAGDATSGSALGWRYLPSTVYLPAAGCYAFQIDIPVTTTVIVLATSP